MTTAHERPEELHEYPAGSLTVEWRPGRCQHSGVCVRGLPLVFDPRRRPWVDVSGADPETIALQVGRCPSGALQIRR
jgi:uncharacterized Fe-S cluster protein YjdI